MTIFAIIIQEVHNSSFISWGKSRIYQYIFDIKFLFHLSFKIQKMFIIYLSIYTQAYSKVETAFLLEPWCNMFRTETPVISKAFILLSIQLHWVNVSHERQGWSCLEKKNYEQMKSLYNIWNLRFFPSTDITLRSRRMNCNTSNILVSLGGFWISCDCGHETITSPSFHGLVSGGFKGKKSVNKQKGLKKWWVQSRTITNQPGHAHNHH